MDSKQVNKIIKKCALVIFGAILLICILFSFQSLKSVLDFIFKILTPFLIGILLALFLNVPMSFFQRKFQKLNKSGETKEYKQISLFLSIICIILVILFVILLIVPELINVGKIISQNIPVYQQAIKDMFNNISNTFPDFDVNSVENIIMTNIDGIKNQFLDQLPTIFSSSFEIISGTINSIVNFFIGVGFALLTLDYKEKIKSNFKKLSYAYKGKEKTDKILNYAGNFISNFNNFVVAQCISALAIGIVCIILSLILQIPYAVQIGVLVGFMSLIPIFGTVIGIIISLILVVFIDPIKALVFLIVTIIIWQVFENIIKPKIVGKKTGISNFLLFIATVAGGTAFGVMGLIFAVPITNTAYLIVKDKVRDREQRKEKEQNNDKTIENKVVKIKENNKEKSKEKKTK